MGSIASRRPSPALVVALVALLLSLGGTSYAVKRIGSRQIANNSVRSVDLKNNDVRSRDVRNASLLAGDFKAGELPAGAQGARGSSGFQYAWSAEKYPADAQPQGDGHVARFSFSAPKAGFALVTAQFGIRVRNTFDTSATDCHVQSDLSATPHVPSGGPGASVQGYIDMWVNGNLPTQAGAGTFGEYHQSVSRIFAITAGNNRFYLNGAHNCQSVAWGPINLTSVFLDSNPGATLDVP
jgi:hypothetical protein